MLGYDTIAWFRVKGNQWGGDCFALPELTALRGLILACDTGITSIPLVTIGFCLLLRLRMFYMNTLRNDLYGFLILIIPCKERGYCRMELNELAKKIAQLKSNQGDNLDEINQKIKLITDIIEFLLQKELEPSEYVDFKRRESHQKCHQEMKAKLRR